MLGAASLFVMLMSAALFWIMREHRVLLRAWVRGISVAMLVSIAMAGLALVLAMVIPWEWSGLSARLVGLAMPLFTMLEWVNYRWVQISAGGLKAAIAGKPVRPQLAKILHRTR
jgi:urea transporter